MDAYLFDLGGTYFRYGTLEGERGTICRKREKLARLVGSRGVWDSVLAEFATCISQDESRLPADAPVVVSCPGPVSADNRLLQAPTMAGTSAPAPDLARLLGERTGRAVHLVNDLAAAAWHLSEGVAESRFLVVTVSSGIGSKIFDRGHRSGVLDVPPYGGEIGHLVVDESESAPACDCGRRGHLGAVASGVGIERAARRCAANDAAGFRESLCCRRFGATSNTLNNEDHLVPAALEGDGWATAVVRDGVRPLARVLATALMAAGLERIIVIGGFANSLGEAYLRLLRRELAMRLDYDVLPPEIENSVVLGEPGEEACLLGAAAFARGILAGGTGNGP